MVVDIKADVDGKTLKQFEELIEKRRKLLHETTEQSVIACSIQVLKSIRAATKVAKTKGQPLEFCSMPGLYYSMKREGKGKPVPCLRFRGSNTEFKLQKGSVFVIVEKGVKASLTQIYLWVKVNGVKYYLAATSEKAAKKYMMDREKMRIERYKGLAKMALGILMNKVSTSANASANENAGDKVNGVATRNTNVRKQLQQGVYEVTIEDNLEYAKDAVKGGEGEINTCLQKAMNMITSTINHKCEKLLSFEPLEIPFPKN